MNRLALVCSLLALPAWLGFTYPAAAQGQAVPPTGRALLTQADTTAALQQLFQKKRESNGYYLAAVPVGIGVSLVGMGLTAIGALDGVRPNTTAPLMLFAGGIAGTVLALRRYSRYTKSSEQDLLNRYERKRRLPAWVKRQLRQQQAGGTRN